MYYMVEIVQGLFVQDIDVGFVFVLFVYLVISIMFVVQGCILLVVLCVWVGGKMDGCVLYKFVVEKLFIGLEDQILFGLLVGQMLVCGGLVLQLMLEVQMYLLVCLLVEELFGVMMFDQFIVVIGSMECIVLFVLELVQMFDVCVMCVEYYVLLLLVDSLVQCFVEVVCVLFDEFLQCVELIVFVFKFIEFDSDVVD